ncbi:MAG: SIR2 family protein [Oscillospiraceae bacterium]|nr:SIR2 family protein [Oscillospiraceae bacterium]
MCIISQEQLIRNFKIMNNGEIDFFLGAGASIQSGIPTGGNLVWYFKREIYCIENNISTELYKDLKLPSTQRLLQDYFDNQGGHPCQYDPEEYSHYFERCYNTVLSRKRFIENLVADKKPSLGYLCLANYITSSKIKNVWTTNFDSLVETALNTLSPTFTYAVCSSANQSSFPMLNPAYPSVCKLHGDYRYDRLQNTTSELQGLETKIHSFAYTQLAGKGLVVIGYSGNDESIMSFFEGHIEEPGFLSKGLFWAVQKGSTVSKRVKALIENAVAAGKDAAIVEIAGFDDFLYASYKSINIPNLIIDNKWREHPSTKKDLVFSGSRIDSFIKLNAYVADNYPPCHVFETDIQSWEELRKCIDGQNIIAALYSQHIYCFANTEHINTVFCDHIKSAINLEHVKEKILYNSDSIYTGMLYQLLNQHMIFKGMIEYRKNTYYDPNAKSDKSGYVFYEAVEVALSFINNKFYLNLLPTVHVMSNSGKDLDKVTYQDQINKAVSGIYNKQYNDNLKQWEKLLRTSGKMFFECEGFQIEFQTPAISCGGTNRDAEWPSLPAWVYPEPLMCFSENDPNKSIVNQLKGLVSYGPIDCSYALTGTIRNPVKLAIFAPNERMSTILSHLNSLNGRQASTSKDQFLLNYEGFDSVFRRVLKIPAVGDSDICVGYSEKSVLSMNAQEFLAFLKRGVDHFATKAIDFNVLVIYIPRSFAPFREAKEISADFNLHDAIKLHATDRGIKIQFIEERSINTYDPCKVLWGLSTSIYAKSSGVLWHPQAINDGTAYVGISYAQSEEKGICIGCSQLFDSTGTGIRMILRKIDNPRFWGKKNPYMGREEARSMMSELREQYYHSDPIAKLNRIVIHKTTPFMREEIIGITQAFEGVDNIELVQIQSYCPWRAIRFGQQASKVAESFAVKRGTTIQLSSDSFLLWTHGCIIHPDLAGRLNYYKGGRGIPTPLLIKRHYGQASGDTLAQEILMLTKMNWNSGDSLYKILPVTLDFAKVLARMSKQNEAIYNKAYDFRYFM